jgi:hypothetical protein
MDDEQTEVKSGHLSFLLLHNRIRKYSISLFQMTLSVRMLISKTTKEVQHSGGVIIRINGRSKAPNKMKGMYKEQLQRGKKIQPSKICSRKNINSHVNCLHRSRAFVPHVLLTSQRLCFYSFQPQRSKNMCNCSLATPLCRYRMIITKFTGHLSTKTKK